ncbi:hypothetical protein F0562_016166 [Nyssa sinensis]|uniref:Uncharacterized protein n=1 Tax=Nyssa sinensis TaxID=561372 RepID=A0A5J4ZK44_9ASTE|nr:hypothetical protein F0562_016166 [Nyssa sinensis]
MCFTKGIRLMNHSPSQKTVAPIHDDATIPTKRSPEIINCLLRARADPNVTDKDGITPIQVAAARGNRNAVEILFLVTSQIQTVAEWTVDEILEHMQSETGKEQEESRNLKEVNGLEDTPTTKLLVTAEAKKKAAEAEQKRNKAGADRENSGWATRE